MNTWCFKMIRRKCIFYPNTILCLRTLNISMFRNSSDIRTKDSSKTESGINNCPNSCLCSNNIEIDYKNTRLLSQFVSPQTGMILPRTYTRVCMRKQREIAKAIKRSRTMGFMPYTSKQPEYLTDPKLFQ